MIQLQLSTSAMGADIAYNIEANEMMRAIMRTLGEKGEMTIKITNPYPIPILNPTSGRACEWGVDVAAILMPALCGIQKISGGGKVFPIIPTLQEK